MTWTDLLKALEQFKGDSILDRPVKFLDNEMFTNLTLFRSVTSEDMMLVPDYGNETPEA